MTVRDLSVRTNEPFHLSIWHSDQSADVSAEGLSFDNNNTSKEQAPVHEEEQLTPIPIPEPGENIEVGCFDEMAVLVNQHMETDNLCYSVSEVKLYRLTKSELEKYLGKLPNEKTPAVCTKGDNKGTASNTDDEQSPQAPTPPSLSLAQLTPNRVDLYEQQLPDKPM